MSRHAAPGPLGRDEQAEAFELLAPYALDAVDDRERALVERLLAVSAPARAELDELRRDAARLGEAIPPEAPPASLKASIFARLDDVVQLPPVGAPPTDAAADAATDAEARRARHLRPVDAPAAPAAVPGLPEGDVLGDPLAGGRAAAAARRRWFARPGAVVATAAASVALIVAAVVGVNWIGPAGWGAQRDVAAVAEAPDAERAAAETSEGGEVELTWSAELERSAIRASDLPEPGDDRVYQLWYIDADGATSAGTFAPASGDAYVVLDGAFEPGLVVGITVEPEGGSEAPTTEPIVVFET